MNINTVSTQTSLACLAIRIRIRPLTLLWGLGAMLLIHALFPSLIVAALYWLLLMVSSAVHPLVGVGGLLMALPVMMAAEEVLVVLGRPGHIFLFGYPFFLAGSLYHLLTKRHVSIPIHMVLFYVLIASLGALSILVGDSDVGGPAELYTLVSPLLLSFVTALFISRDRKNVSLLATAFILTALIAIPLAIMELGTLEGLGRYLRLGGGVSPLAGLLGPAVLFSVMALFWASPWNRETEVPGRVRLPLADKPILALAVLAVSGMALVATMNRGVILGTLLAMLALLLMPQASSVYRRTKRVGMRRLLLTYLLIGAIAAGFLTVEDASIGDRLERRLRSIPQQVASDSRYRIWDAALQTMQPHEIIFGGGLGSFEERTVRGGLARPFTPHSFYVDILVCMGLVGLAVILGMMLALFLRSLKKRDVLAVTLLAYLLFAHLTRQSSTSLYPWIILGAVYGLASVRLPRSSWRSGMRPQGEASGDL